MSEMRRTALDLAMWEQRWTNRRLARHIGAHETEVSRWKLGVHLPEEATREAIANALRLKVDEVFPPQPEAAQAA